MDHGKDSRNSRDESEKPLPKTPQRPSYVEKFSDITVSVKDTRV